MSSRPELSIIMPLYNGERFVTSTLDSLHAQTDVDAEIIVVDDGSTDFGLGLALDHPVCPRILRQENSGVAVARNRGLAEAAGSWVAFVDQDDLWHPNRARRMLDLATATGKRMVATTETPFAVESDRAALNAVGDGRELWPRFWVREGSESRDLVRLLPAADAENDTIEHISYQRFLAAPVSLTTSFMFDRTSAIAAGGCATFVRALDDHIFYLNLARLVGGAARLEAPLLFYRVHPASTTVSSPLAAAYLSALLALRWGRVFGPAVPKSDYLDHLISQLPQSPLTKVEQWAILMLSVPTCDRPRYMARWLKRSARMAFTELSSSTQKERTTNRADEGLSVG